MKASKTNQTRWEWHYITFTPSLHLVPFCQLCPVFVICSHRRVVEGSGVGGIACWRSHVVSGCNLIATEHGRCGLSCMQNCGVHEQCYICMACWSVSYALNFCCCWTWQVVLYAEGYGVSSAECWVCSYPSGSSLQVVWHLWCRWIKILHSWLLACAANR